MCSIGSPIGRGFTFTTSALGTAQSKQTTLLENQAERSSSVTFSRSNAVVGLSRLDWFSNPAGDSQLNAVLQERQESISGFAATNGRFG